MATARISSASAAAHGKRRRRVHGRVRRVSVVRGCAAASSAFPEYGGRVGEKESLGKRVKRALKGVKEKLRERAAKNAEVRADPAVVKSTRKTMKDVYIFRSILPLCASVAAAGPEAFDINYMIKGMCMTLSRFLELYSIILILKILISWFPNVDISMEPFKTLDQITEPFFLLFRSLLPPLMGIDFTPILGMMALGWVQQLLFDFGYYDNNRDNFMDEMANNLDVGKTQTMEQVRDAAELDALEGNVDVGMLENVVGTRAQIENRIYTGGHANDFNQSDFDNEGEDTLEDLFDEVTNRVGESARGDDDL